MKILLAPSKSTECPTVLIEYKHSDSMDMNDVLENLVRPALIAWGFHPGTVAEYFDYDIQKEETSKDWEIESPFDKVKDSFKDEITYG